MSNPLGGYTVVSAPPSDILPTGVSVVSAPPSDIPTGHSLFGSVKGAVTTLADMIGPWGTHLPHTAATMAKQIFYDAQTGFFAPVRHPDGTITRSPLDISGAVQDLIRKDPNKSAAYAKAFGVDKNGAPTYAIAPVTEQQHRDAAVNSFINAVLPKLPVSLMGKALGRAAVGGAVGAHYDPADRLRGALVGGTIGAVLPGPKEAPPGAEVPPGADVPPPAEAPPAAPGISIVDAPPPDVAPPAAPAEAPPAVQAPGLSVVDAPPPDIAAPSVPEPGYHPTMPSDLPIAGSTINGLRITDNVPNQSSIEASVDHPTVLPGVREVPMADIFGEHLQGKNLGYASASDTRQVRNLAEQIKQNGYIDPLIITHDAEGYSILEGGHRVEALRSLGHPTFPAVIVEDGAKVSSPPAPGISVVAAPPPDIAPTSIGTPYEQAMRAGTLGTPKDTPQIPSAVANDPRGIAAAAIRKDPASGTTRVTLPNADAAAIAATIDVTPLVEGSRTAFTTPETIALGQAVNDGITKVTTLQDRLAASTDPAERADLNAQLDAAAADLGRVGRVQSLGGSEAGRNLQALQLQAANIHDPAFWMSQLQRNQPGDLPLDAITVRKMTDIFRIGLKEPPPRPTLAQPLPVPPEIADAKAAVQDVLDALPKTTDTKGVGTADFTDARFRAKIEAALAAVNKGNFVYHFSDEAQMAHSQAILRQAFDLHTDPLEMPGVIPRTGPRPNPIETTSKYFEVENKKLDALIADINHPTPTALSGSTLDPVTGLPVVNPVGDYITQARAVEKSRAAADIAQAKYEARAGAQLDKQAQQQLVALAQENSPTSFWEKMTAYKRANLIDAPSLLDIMAVSHAINTARTLVINPLSASLHDALYGTEFATANAGERGAMLSTLRATAARVTGWEAAKTAYREGTSQLDGLQKAGSAAWQTITNPAAGVNPYLTQLADQTRNPESVARQLGRPTVKFVNPNAPAPVQMAQKLVQVFYDGVYGLHRVVYSPFQEAAISGSIYASSVRRALGEGLAKDSPEFAARVTDLSGPNPNLADLTEALTDGARAVFREKNWMSEGIQKLEQANPVTRVVVPQVMPFATVPINLLHQSLVEANPIGAIAKAGHLFLQGDKLAAFRVLLSGGAIGGAVMYLGYQHQLAGGMAPPASDNPDEQNINRQSGIPPNGARLSDGTWFNLARLGPYGIVAQMGAALARTHQQTGADLETTAGSLAGSSLQIIKDMPFMQGPRGVIDALSGAPGAKKIPAVVGSILSTYIPGGSFTAAVARGLDPVQQRESGTLLGQIANRTPGWRNQLEPRKTPLGDILPSSGGVAQQVFVPYTPTSENRDPLSVELRRVNAGIQPLSKRPGELPAEFAARRTLTDPIVRQVLEAVTQSDPYHTLPTTDQNMLLKEIAHRMRGAIGAQVPAVQGALGQLHKLPAYTQLDAPGRKAMEQAMLGRIHDYLARTLLASPEDAAPPENQPQ